MNFWDTSALAALLLEESGDGALRSILESDSEAAVWWGTQVEFASAVSRREREGNLSAEKATDFLHEFDNLATQSLHEVQPSRRLRSTAQRLLRVHPLRAADGLQLAAALTVAREDPSRIGFVCLDARLNEAALREGFPILVSR